MTLGRAIKAEIDIPGIVEIPLGRKTVGLDARISLMNEGSEAFVAHARNKDDASFWHVFDQHQAEVQREKGAGKGGACDVRVSRGVHSYQTVSVETGAGVHGARKLVLDASKLEAGHTYTVRGEFYGHRAEATFVAVPAAAPARKKAAPKKKAAAKPRAAKKKAVRARKKK